MFVFATPCLVCAAFLLLLLVALSAPITHSIYLFKLTAEIPVNAVASVATTAKFGVWGYCTSAVDIAEYQPPGCSHPRLGYNFDQNAQSLLSPSSNQTGTNPKAISKGLTVVLVLHPIVCALTFVFLVLTLYLLFRRNKIVHARTIPIFILSFGISTPLLSTVVFLIDVILVAVVRSSIKKQTNGAISIVWGNGVWMALGASVALWVAEASACLGVLVGRRNRRAGRY
ncbi:pali-domain-containing protein [Irpex rosettiformis]|uniref:Pali-domain-containing protein n=1 Tax=Irpex rosettiformis TaxID=378272 RepID=A0ACB8UHD1_9APHY|nr:pali-domain-containing protein [Irpex rosettiformis]